MKAADSRHTHRQAAMREVPEPTAGDGQVVVSIRSASLNFRDLVTIRAYGRKSAALGTVFGWPAWQRLARVTDSRSAIA